MVDGSSSSSRLENHLPDARWTRRPNTVSRKRSFMKRNLIVDLYGLKGEQNVMFSTKIDEGQRKSSKDERPNIVDMIMRER